MNLNSVSISGDHFKPSSLKENNESQGPCSRPRTALIHLSLRQLENKKLCQQVLTVNRFYFSESNLSWSKHSLRNPSRGSTKFFSLVRLNFGAVLCLKGNHNSRNIFPPPRQKGSFGLTRLRFKTIISQLPPQAAGQTLRRLAPTQDPLY